jgi:hypothetical protein
MENVDPVGRSQDLPDADCLLTFKQMNPNGSPHCAAENLQAFGTDILVTVRWDEQQMRNNHRLYSLQSNNNIICHFSVCPVRGGPNRWPIQECNNGICWYSCMCIHGV